MLYSDLKWIFLTLFVYYITSLIFYSALEDIVSFYEDGLFR